MKITWYGHACFLVSGKEGSLLTDPYGEEVPYGFPDAQPDVVTVSHEHGDHNATHRVKGAPSVVRGVGRHQVGRFSIEGLESAHDAVGGMKRGKNTIFRFQVDAILLAHLGDLGGPLSDAALAALADVDVLFVPVGGTYTIDAEEAAFLLKRLSKVRVAIPMHYHTDRMTEKWPIRGVDNFVRRVQNARTIGGSEVTLTRASLPASQEVWILDYA